MASTDHMLECLLLVRPTLGKAVTQGAAERDQSVTEYCRSTCLEVFDAYGRTFQLAGQPAGEAREVRLTPQGINEGFLIAAVLSPALYAAITERARHGTRSGPSVIEAGRKTICRELVRAALQELTGITDVPTQDGVGD